MKISTLWTSAPLTIGKHDWRIGVGHYRLSDGHECRCTFHQWRRREMHGHKQPWCEAEDWPSYDDHASNDGLPKTLARLYEREKPTVRALIDGAYSVELTPEGEQTVIPGCERNTAPGMRQLDLFG